MKALVCTVGLWCTVTMAAVEDPLHERYQALLYELRCLVCQNQSLADSDAELAGDLRHRVRSLMDAGHSDEEILQHLQARYGDFVLYRPVWSAYTVVLWVGPFVLLLLTAWAVLRHVRRQHATRPDALSEEECRRRDRLLERDDS